jgi:hypothetical protein
VLALGKRHRERLDDACDELVLYLKNVADRQLRHLRPQQRAGGHFGQLSADTYLIRGAQQRSGEHHVDVGVVRDCVQVRPVCKSRRRHARPHHERFEAGQRCGDCFGQAECKEVRLRVRPQHAKRKDDEAGNRCGDCDRWSLDRHDKTIPTARKRLDISRRARIIAERLANLADAEVQTLIEVDEGAITPDLPVDFLARHDLAAALHQQRQQLNGLRCELHEVGALAHFSAASIELERSEAKHSRRRRHGADYSDGPHRKLIPNSARAHGAGADQRL